MEPNIPLQETQSKVNWFDRHKVLTCFAIITLFLFGTALFHHNPDQVAVQGDAIDVPTATPRSIPTNTPTPTAVPTVTPTPTTVIAPLHPTMQISEPVTTQEQGLSNNNYYMNSSGNEVHSPAYSNDGSVPSGATAKCADGTYSFSEHHSGTCSHHGGVAQWL